MKVIFLDVDGVLNSTETCKALGGYGGWFGEKDKVSKQNILWGEDQVKHFRAAVEATGAKIVISSTWRVHFSVRKFKEMFEAYGWNNAPVIGKTPRMEGWRGNEVDAWLSDKSPDAYVIIDDSRDFHPHQKENFVNTNPRIGFTEDDAKRTVEILSA